MKQDESKKSMAEIAELAGVSIATVSRVLNHNGRFSPQTEKRVLSVIDKYGYIVNQSAKGLRTSKTQSIGVIVPDITNEFFAKIVRSVEQNLLDKDYTVFVCDSNENEMNEDKHISSLASKGVDGIIYISVKSDVKEIYEHYHIPVVYIDRRPENAGILISSDNENGGFLATEELIKSGCKHIAVLRDQKNHSTVKQRLSGYKKALDKYNLKYDEALVKGIDISYKAAYDEVVKLIENKTEFDGIFCNNDLIAIAALHALREKGLSVPDDVKLIGYDGVSYSDICNPKISTIAQDTDEFGKRSVEELFELIDNEKAVSKDLVIPVSLIKRESTG